MSKPEGANSRQVGGDHYSNHGIGTTANLQHWDWCWQNGYDQFQYCITKYIHRHRAKDGLRDLEKAMHHLQKYIELIKEEQQEMSRYTNQD